jgi:hypothetical protein
LIKSQKSKINSLAHVITTSKSPARNTETMFKDKPVTNAILCCSLVSAGVIYASLSLTGHFPWLLLPLSILVTLFACGGSLLPNEEHGELLPAVLGVNIAIVSSVIETNHQSIISILFNILLPILLGSIIVYKTIGFINCVNKAHSIN